MTISDQQYAKECEFLDGMCACRPYEDTPEMRELVHNQAVRLAKILRINPLITETEFEEQADRIEHEVTP